MANKRARLHRSGANGGAARPQLEIVGSRRSIDKQWVHTDLIRAQRAPARIRHDPQGPENDVVIDSATAQRGSVTGYGVVDGHIEDIVLDNDIPLTVPQNDVAVPTTLAGEREGIVGDH